MTGRASVDLPAQTHVARLTTVSARTLPASGNAALVSSAIVQAALGIEFTLSGLNKAADPAYVTNFTSFVQANPGSTTGPLAPIVGAVVLPNAAVFSALLEGTELALGLVLLIGAVEIGRRRFTGRIGARHGYEATLALVAAFAGLTAAGLAFSIFVLMGGVLPTVMPGRAFTTAIPVELLIVPLGLSVAWLEFGRFLVLRHHEANAASQAA